MKITDSMIERAYDVLNSGDFRDRGDLVREALEAALAPYQATDQRPAKHEPQTAVGQVWRRREPNSKGAHRVVVIRHIDRMGRIRWEAADDTAGPPSGHGSTNYWAKRHTYIEGP